MHNPLRGIAAAAAAVILLAAPGRALQLPASDPRIAEIVSQISPDRIASTVRELAAFGTRHTLSDTSSNSRGIGAARRWLRSEFEHIAAGSRGRMTVEYQQFEVPPSNRVPR